MIRRAILFVSFALIVVPEVSAQCAFTFAGTTTGVSTINFTPIGQLPANAPQSALGDALNVWAYGCGGYAYSYPELTQGPFNSSAGVLNVYVNFQPGQSPNRCGETSVNVSQTTGQIESAFVTVYGQSSTGSDCTGNFINLIAHEIGHVLGLGDVDQDPSCNGTIMGSAPTFISSDQCEMTKANWDTVAEQQDELNYQCELTCRTFCVAGQCDSDSCFYYNGQPSSYCSQSPIVLDLDGNGIHLSSVEEGVAFDLTADDVPEHLSWTTADQRDGWLALDRDGNGRIETGEELFGNYTPLADGQRARNGYEALREFDHPARGGNGDGVLDHHDAIWPELRVWIDGNHDGVSQPGELSSMLTAGVVRLDTRYERSERRDPHGNFFRYRAKARILNPRGQARDVFTYDVFLKGY